MNHKKIINVLVLLFIVFFISGCSFNLSLKKSQPVGIFASYDKGSKWVSKTELLNVGETRSFFNGSQITFLKVDPNDPKIIYAGTIEDGLFYSLDKANSWQRTLASKGVINDIAIDPKDSCTIYALVSNTLYKTTDCARKWKDIYSESGKSLKSIDLDPFNTQTVYIGIIDGRLLRSSDGGYQWSVLKSFDSSINEILINPKDSKKIYLGLKNNGIYKSDDNGESWRDITETIKEVEKDVEIVPKGVKSFRSLVLDPSKEDSLFYASQYGIFVSENGGNSWTRIKLLTKAKAVDIYAFAINPNNSKEIYYSTPTAFLKSVDGGKEWMNVKSPSQNLIYSILVDKENGNNVFIGLRSLK